MNKKKYAVLTMIVVGIFDLIMFIITLVNRNSGKISEKTETLDSSLKIIVLALLVVFTPIYFVIKHIFENKEKFLYFNNIGEETFYSQNNKFVRNHYVYGTLLDLANSKFVLVLDENSKIISPAVYTKRKDKISIINRDTEYILFEHIEFSDDAEYDYAFIRTCTLKNKKTGEQVLFVAVPNRETDILAYSDSAHKADKTVTFGKFRIFCFVETDNSPYTDLIVDSEKIHLEKSKRKGMYFIGLDEVKKKKY